MGHLRKIKKTIKIQEPKINNIQAANTNAGQLFMPQPVIQMLASVMHNLPRQDTFVSHLFNSIDDIITGYINHLKRQQIEYDLYRIHCADQKTQQLVLETFVLTREAMFTALMTAVTSFIHNLDQIHKIRIRTNANIYNKQFHNTLALAFIDYDLLYVIDPVITHKDGDSKILRIERCG